MFVAFYEVCQGCLRKGVYVSLIHAAGNPIFFSDDCPTFSQSLTALAALQTLNLECERSVLIFCVELRALQRVRGYLGDFENRMRVGALSAFVPLMRTADTHMYAAQSVAFLPWLTALTALRTLNLGGKV